MADPISAWQDARISCSQIIDAHARRSSGLPHIAFENFAEATKLLAGWLEERGRCGYAPARAVDTK